MISIVNTITWQIFMMLLMSEEQLYESASAPSVIVSGLFALLMSQQNAANLIGG
jgi:hypothetical protein